MIRRAALVLLCLSTLACGSSSPTNPSPTPTPTSTRVIRLEANLAYGTIDIGQTFDATLRIYSDGTAPLTVTGLNGPAGYAASWTSGTIAPGTSQAVTIRFSPTAAQTYNGTLTVLSDATSGTNTTQVSGRGQGPPFKKTGTGSNVFDLPSNVSRVHITGDYGGSCENFVVKIAGKLIVNEILGSCSIAIGRHFDGTFLVTGGGVTEVTFSNGIAWAFEEVR